MLNVFSCLLIMMISSAIYAKTYVIDPTRPSPLAQSNSDPKATEDEPQKLSAIYHYPNYKIAIIDNKIVKVGEQIGSFKVISIGENQAELTGIDNKRIMLKLSPIIKQLHSNKTRNST